MRALEFALSTLMITIVNVIFALWVASVVGNRMAELFTGIVEALGGVL